MIGVDSEARKSKTSPAQTWQIAVPTGLPAMNAHRLAFFNRPGLTLMGRFLLVAVAILALSPFAKAGLLINGTFEAGNVGFTSGAAHSPSNIEAPLTYAVVTNPSLVHSDASSFGDHTTGSGLMLAVNGPADSATVVWRQTVAVAPNSSYTLAGWASSWFSSNPVVLDFQFNGESVGTFTASSTTGLWSAFNATWSSGLSASVTIEIVDTNTNFSGNDFALDDLSLTGPAPAATPEPSTLMLACLAAGGLPMLAQRRNRRAMARSGDRS